MLVVVPSLTYFTFRAERKHNSSERAIRGESWMTLLYPLSPLQKAFFFLWRLHCPMGADCTTGNIFLNMLSEHFVK